MNPTRSQILLLVASWLFISSLATNEAWISYFDYENQGPGTYSFGYEIEDPQTRNIQFRHEEKHPNGTVNGKYGLYEPDGNVRIVHYVADMNGYRTRMENSLTGKVVSYPPITSLDNRPSAEYVAALSSLATIGQNVQEQHTPPKYSENWQDGRNYY